MIRNPIAEIRCSVERRVNRQFRGRIDVYANGQIAWSEVSDIRRLTKEDAQADAESLKSLYAGVV